MKPLIVANWKMNPMSLAQAKKLFSFVKRGLKNIKKAEIIICPPYTQFSIFNFPRSKTSGLLRGRQFSKNIKLGAQNCFWEKKGAYTGEISPAMLKDLGCQYVIVGHSERRRYFRETNEIVNRKLRAVIKAEMTPILCVGESQEQRDKGETDKILKKQLELVPRNVKELCIAYEPIWAIGTGNACDLEEAQKMRLLIRKIISRELRILYGGSVNSKNAKGYIKEAGFQGLLVGGASLDAKEFIDLVKEIC